MKLSLALLTAILYYMWVVVEAVVVLDLTKLMCLQDSVMNACYRGCRLYSICQFVNGNTGFNNSKEECQGGEAW